MPDRIDKLNYGNDVYRVQETQDPLEDQSRDQSQDEGQDEDQDSFDSIGDKTGWQVIFDKKDLFERNVEVAVDDIRDVLFLGINLKGNPSLLTMALRLKDGTVYKKAFVSIPRSQAVRFKTRKRGERLQVSDITSGRSLHITLPQDKERFEEEVTRLTKINEEQTFTRKLSGWVRRTWVQRMGLQDPVTKKLNNEIFLVYVTVFLVLGFLGFGIFYLWD